MRTLPLLPLFLALSAHAAISVTGVSTNTKYDNTRTITVANPAGFTTTATLNGNPFPVGVATVVNEVRLHELDVREVADGSGAVTTQRLVFVIRNSARGGSEDGIPSFTPPPIVNSAPGEFTNAVLRVMMPAAYPSGMEIPVSVRVETPAGDPLFLNGVWTSAAFPGQRVQVRRGFGAGRMPALPPGVTAVVSRLAGLVVTNTVSIDASTAWVSAGGTLAGDTTWPANARVHVTSGLAVPAGITLTIGPGAVVRLGPGVDIDLLGRLNVAGTPEQPVSMVPVSATQPWGGVHARGAGAPRVDATGLLLTGSGEQANWFAVDSTGISTHQDEQAAFTFEACQGSFTNSCLFDLKGQVFAGRSTTLRFIRSHFHRAVAGGQLNGSRNADGTFTSRFIAERSHWSEFPDATRTFLDDDNDGLYLNGGLNSLDRCSWGWCKDDGIDTGGSNTGTLIVRDSWSEACFHESESMSGNKHIAATNTVYVHNGQALECGYEGPTPLVTRCLFTGNMVGLRFGDNYGSGYTYTGFLTASNNISIHNLFQDVWGYELLSWTYRTDRMNVRDNFFTAANARHPDNAVWNPAADAHRLAAYRAAPGAPVGVGLLYDTPQGSLSALGQGFSVGLSSFAEFPVSVDWRVLGRAAAGAPETELAAGSVSFSPGQMVKSVPLAAGLTNGLQFVRVALENPVGAEVTHGRDLWYIAASPSTQNLIPQFGSSWKYLDQNIDPGATWKTLAHNDAAWSTGNAELGYGNGDEAKVVSFGPVSTNKYAACFFRKVFTVPNPGAWTNLQMVLRFDDAAAVHLNGTTVYRTATLPANATHTTYVNTTSANNATVTVNIPVSLLVNGDNIVAAQVHQANATSSDLSFALGLTLQRAPVLTVAPLQTAANDGVILFDPPAAVLEQSDDLQSWTPAPTGGTSPLPFPDGVDRRYYRLRQ